MAGGALQRREGHYLGRDKEYDSVPMTVDDP
jgi:hypothetical protein